MRILIADDNELIRRGIKRLLSDEVNCELCGEASDGKEAIQKALELHPDLILLDIQMPGLHGLEATRVLRRQMPDTKIFVISPHDPVQLSPRAIEGGAQGCLQKSLLGKDLLRTINDICETASVDGYAVSQRKRKRVEGCFGWLKTIALLRKVRHRGLFKVGWVFTFAAAAYNLVRMRNLAIQEN